MKKYSDGGIYIKPENRGSFTRYSQNHGESVQEMANKILANKEDYSPAIIKKANFAHNAASFKHANGADLSSQNFKSVNDLRTYAKTNKIPARDIYDYYKNQGYNVGGFNATDPYNNLGPMVFGAYQQNKARNTSPSSTTAPVDFANAYTQPGPLATPTETNNVFGSPSTIDPSNPSTIPPKVAYANSTLIPTSTNTSLVANDRGNPFGGLGRFLSDNKGDILNTTNFLLNRRDINRLKTDVPTTSLDNPNYLYYDRTGQSRKDINEAAYTASRNMESSNAQVNAANKQALFAKQVDALGRLNTEENLRKDTYDRGYQDRLYNVKSYNARQRDAANQQKIINENDKTRLGVSNRNAFLAGVAQNDATRRAYDVERERLAIEGLKNKNYGNLSNRERAENLKANPYYFNRMSQNDMDELYNDPNTGDDIKDLLKQKGYTPKKKYGGKLKRYMC